MLVPLEITWVDFVIPANDALWERDVGRALAWVGDVWKRTIESLGAGAPSLQIHEGPLQKNRWSGRACFAGLGPGEVTLDGRKLVGLSQRRTREAVRFQCLVHHKFDPAALPELLALDGEERREMTGYLATRVTVLPATRAHTYEALLSLLPP